MDNSSCNVVYHLRDKEPILVEAWKEAFRYINGDTIKISAGDIFRNAPYVDALVSPANSFGFMTGGIDRDYSRHFGWQLQDGPQYLLRHEHGGELPVGQAIIVPMFEPGVTDYTGLWWYNNPQFNDGKVIKYLISAPTMRVPGMDVSNTVNAYLAFRAVIRAVKQHNLTNEDKITSVLCPGLCTSNGKMPFRRCAIQMREAWDIYGNGDVSPPKTFSEAQLQQARLTE